MDAQGPEPGTLSERAIIARIAQRFCRADPRLLVGMGDDAGRTAGRAGLACLRIAEAVAAEGGPVHNAPQSVMARNSGPPR